MRNRRLCPYCQVWTTATECCGEVVMPTFRMDTARVKALRRFVHGQKGLDQDTYRMHLRAVGVESTLDLTRETHEQLLERLRKLPDWKRAQGRARR